MLFESASGYALFERVESELIGEQLDEVQDAIQDMGRFGRMVHLKAFVPFSSAENALSNINDVSEGEYFSAANCVRLRLTSRLDERDAQSFLGNERPQD